MTDHHLEFLQLLPDDAHARASSVVIITGDDASQYIPRVLREQLNQVKSLQDVALLIPPNSSGHAWSTSHTRLKDFPPLPSATTSGDVWQLVTKPAARPPADRSVTITLPRPIRADSVTVDRLSEIADLAADPSNSNLQRRTNRAEDKVKSLYTDMHNVLHTLKSQCITYGQSITAFVQQEDADLLTQTCHDA
jgi:hypothetical protein